MSTEQPDLSSFTDEPDDEGAECPTCGDVFEGENAATRMKIHHTKAHDESLLERDCEHCGDSFVAESSTSDQRFCSPDCFDAHRARQRSTAECAECGDTFETPEPERRTYCSKACQIDALSHDPEDLVRECEHCGAEFTVDDATSEQRYCSTDCRYATRSNPATVECAHCGEDFEVAQSAAERATYCSNDCRHAAMVTLDDRECPTCGDVFHPRHAEQEYCSRECVSRAQRKRVELECAECGDPFEVKPVHAERGQQYCSLDCHYTARDKTVERECAECGDTFETKSYYDREYCSRECNARSQRNRERTTCRYCGSTFEHPASEDRSFCSQTCWKANLDYRPRLLRRPYLGLIETLHELFVVEDMSIAETARRIPDHGYDWVRSRLIEFGFYDPTTDVPLAKRLEQTDPDEIGLGDPEDGDQSYKRFY